MADRKESDTTYFGNAEVRKGQKQGMVDGVFSSVANRYDLMNDLMSGGMHRLWKRFALAQSGFRQGQLALDLASGTADVAIALAGRTKNRGRVVASDINLNMLSIGRDRIIDQGVMNNMAVTVNNGESLPFREGCFDLVTIAFGIRNMTNMSDALKEAYRVLLPGGRCLILEFSKPILPLLENAYRLYSEMLIPRLGQWITGDRKSYQYLVASIARHPDQQAFKTLIAEAGFDEVKVFNLSAGIVALHIGIKY